MLEKNIGGCDPANGEASISSSGNTGAFYQSDMNTVMPVLKRTHTTKTHPQYSIDPPHMQGYATMPDNAQWLTPEWQHTEDAPWCNLMLCLCHFQQWRMERYFIGPIERGVMDIAEAIDLYHAEPGYMARKREAAMEREGVLV